MQRKDRKGLNAKRGGKGDGWGVWIAKRGFKGDGENTIIGKNLSLNFCFVS